MYQILGYFAANAAGAALADTPAIIDPNFSSRGGANGAAHWIFTEQYDLKAIAAFGAQLTAAQLFDPMWNAINIPQIYPPNLAITPPSNPQVMDLRTAKIGVPMNEEIACQLSNGLGMGTDPEYVLIWIAPTGQEPTFPAPAFPAAKVKANITFTTALTAGVWTGDVAINFVNPLKGGTYCVCCGNMVVASAIAWRLNFVRAPLYYGRKLLPGDLVEAAYGNIPLLKPMGWMGPMGYFNNFELPKIAILASSTVASATYNGFLDLIYLGDNMTTNQPMGNSTPSMVYGGAA
jgi:hypothetical protein